MLCAEADGPRDFDASSARSSLVYDGYGARALRMELQWLNLAEDYLVTTSRNTI
jgi:hypothetical protein